MEKKHERAENASNILRSTSRLSQNKLVPWRHLRLASTGPTGPDQRRHGDARRGTPVLGRLCGALTSIKTLVSLGAPVTNTHPLLNDVTFTSSHTFVSEPRSPERQEGGGSCGGARLPGT